ncbi:MAG: hypothetical protein ACRENP_24530 [Longimicrobiales bacterium]
MWLLLVVTRGSARSGEQSRGEIGSAQAAHHASRVRRDALFPAVALLGCAILASTIVPVPDHGYQFYLGAQILDGARLYVDVAAADMHPPLFTWLAALLEAVGRVLGTDGLTLYPSTVCLIIAASLVAVWRIGPRSVFILSVMVLALLPLAGPFFGQGEQWALVLSMPYLAAAAVDARESKARALLPRLVIAFTAGFGLAMKPHFALVWLGIEIYLARRRGIRSLLRLECVTIGLLFVAYVVATAAFTPEFFRLLPWLMELYPRFAPVALLDVIVDWRTALLALGLAAGRIVKSGQDWERLADVLSIAALAMFAAVLLQKKGWGYHWYPVNALSVLLCAIALRPYLESFRVLVPAMTVAAMIWMHFQIERTTRLVVSAPGYLPQMMELVEQHARGGSIQALTHTLNVGFPLVNFTHVRWASPYAHLWMIPAIYDRAWAGHEPFHYRRSGAWQDREQQMFDRLWEHIERENPALILVQKPLRNGFDTRAYFATDARFRQRFEQSVLIDSVGHYLVLGRAGETR